MISTLFEQRRLAITQLFEHPLTRFTNFLIVALTFEPTFLDFEVLVRQTLVKYLLTPSSIGQSAKHLFVFSFDVVESICCVVNVFFLLILHCLQIFLKCNNLGVCFLYTSFVFVDRSGLCLEFQCMRMNLSFQSGKLLHDGLNVFKNHAAHIRMF